MINTDKLASDILFIMLPAFSIIITMAWRELLLEYINTKYDHLSDLERKTLVTLMVSVIGITVFYIFRENV
jgi:ABC-type Mn2+/Zn2+ transport system permease subunit